jgi:hypothetical protein
MDSPNLDRVLRFKNNAMRGGLIEHVYMRDVEVGQVADAVVSIDFYYEEGDRGSFTPVVRQVEVRNVKSRKSKYALYLRGFKNAPITDIRLEDCVFDGVAQPNVMEHVQSISMRNVRINGQIIQGNPNSQIRNPKQISMIKIQKPIRHGSLEHSEFGFEIADLRFQI